ncbi:MAG: hypothetical protein SWJ54_25180, partial [Cyanobacteriota bacterium]|nr:hypothetical protein [Cyanobacteriota bacterium]
MLNLVDVFDENFYLEVNPDVDDALSQGIIQSAFDHYTQFGQVEGRNASLFFDAPFYLATNPGVAAAVEQGDFTAVGHFIQFGQFEERDPNSQFNTATYLSENQDVAEVLPGNIDLTAFQHFIEFGINERRTFSEDFIGTQFDVVVTSAANNGNSAALQFDGLTGRFIGEFPIGGSLTDPRDIVLDVIDPSTVLINSGDDNVLRFQASNGTFIESFIEFPNLNGGGAVFGPDDNYYIGARSLSAILRFNGQTGEFIDEFIPSEAVDFPRGFVFGSDQNFYLGNGA